MQALLHPTNPSQLVLLPQAVGVPGDIKALAQNLFFGPGQTEQDDLPDVIFARRAGQQDIRRFTHLRKSWNAPWRWRGLKRRMGAAMAKGLRHLPFTHPR